MKPFKPPTLVGRPPVDPQISAHPEAPPPKKRRISVEQDDDDVEVVAAAAAILKKSAAPKTFLPPARKPLEVVQNPSSALPPNSQIENGFEGYFTVLWRKFSTKKNKTWDGDGVLTVSRGYARLQDISGKDLGRSACKGALLVGSELSVGGKDVEIESMISKADFLAGRPFLHTSNPPPPTLRQVDQTTRVTAKAKLRYDRVVEGQKDPIHACNPATKASKFGFKTPILKDRVQLPVNDAKVPIPRHNPKSEGALVMKRPQNVPQGKQVVDVVMDPLLTQHLREHQRTGVKFMYECVMGMKTYNGEGAILADEMGLGKTLQTIALLWTLLKQNPIYGDQPVIRKALIVCPVTLINNWRREFKKWLGADRIGVFVAESKKVRLTDFTKGKAYSVMIIGYEKLRIVQADLQKADGIDIVIADEGHRLKASQNKSALAIKSLNTERRIILSGTPLQNDLSEFYTMVDFVNPGVLGKYTTFRKEFESAIVKSQQPGASAKDLEKGEARSEELGERTRPFILRRTADILSQYLPPKTEYVVFCRPTKAQLAVYRQILGSPTVSKALGTPAISLELINILKKVCNSPNLVLQKDDKGEGAIRSELLEHVPSSLLKSPGASGKLQVLDSLLHRIRNSTEEKVVLISNYTSTLDVLANLLTSLSYSYLRLDGQTPQNKRQDLVDRFNRSPPKNSFVFLLSAKAGGIGLNLIGASRLILYDLDWNPAIDSQAMARIHRDGQKRPCYIYRLLTQGAMDEKIFQRQASKIGLADSIVDGKAAASGFTREELRDLFTLDESGCCQTHRLLGCGCGGNGMPLNAKEEAPGTPRNDLALLSGNNDDGEDTVPNEDGIEVLNLEKDDDPSSFESGLWRSAKDYDWRSEEAGVDRNYKGCKDSLGKAKMLSLMQYAHFDTSNVSEDNVEIGEAPGDETEEDIVSASSDPLEGVIEDAVLQKVLREDGQRISFVFSKLSC